MTPGSELRLTPLKKSAAAMLGHGDLENDLLGMTELELQEKLAAR